MSPLAQKLLAKAKKIGKPPVLKSSKKYEDCRPAVVEMLGEGWTAHQIIQILIVPHVGHPVVEDSAEWWRWYQWIRRVIKSMPCVDETPSQ
jgi:hypothetical protein